MKNILIDLWQEMHLYQKMLSEEELKSNIVFSKATITQIEEELKTNVTLKKSLDVNKFVLKAFETELSNKR